MKKKTLKLSAVVLLFSLLVIGFLGAKRLSGELQYTRDMSRFGALEMALSLSLSDYYDKHHLYPETISELDDLMFSDGSSEDMLQMIDYQSEGKRCEFSYDRRGRNKKEIVHVECWLDSGKSMRKREVRN